MKKLYTLSFIVFSSIASFAQTFYSENMGTPTATTTVTNYLNGTAPATFQNSAPIIYSGTGDVRTSVASNTYIGASGGGNAYLTGTAGKYFQIDGLNTAAYASADLQLSFGYLTNNLATQVVLEMSTDATNWAPIAFTNNANTTWNLITIGGGVIPSTPSLSLRFTQPATAQMRFDDIKLSSVSASCTLVLAAETTLCDAFTLAIDTYTVTLPYSGGGNATYAITATAGTVGGDNPTNVAAGNIIVSGVPEGTPVSIIATGGTCNFTRDIIAPDCKGVNELPFIEHFDNVVGSSLGTSQKWSNSNSGDDVLISAGNISYSGAGTSSANSISYFGAGKDPFCAFTATSSGMVYASFLMNVTSMDNVTVDLSETYFMGLTNALKSYQGRMFFKKNGTQFQLGFDFANVTTNYDATLYDINTPMWIVIGYDFGTASYSVWINQNVGAATLPTPKLTLTPAIPIAELGGFYFRQDSDTKTPTINADELKITTSIADLALATNQNEVSGLNVYPNPVTKGVLYINSNSTTAKNVVIFDLLGKQVLQTVTANEVNVNGLKSGVYFVKITENGNSATRKLVIQ